MFDQHVKQSSLASIVPDLASNWSWNEKGTQLSLPLRHGVKWHDGKPFTAQDVKCTWVLLMDAVVAKLAMLDVALPALAQAPPGTYGS